MQDVVVKAGNEIVVDKTKNILKKQFLLDRYDEKIIELLDFELKFNSEFDRFYLFPKSESIEKIRFHLFSDFFSRYSMFWIKLSNSCDHGTLCYRIRATSNKILFVMELPLEEYPRLRTDRL